jgi:ribonuclease BN (tRNA processing enzyme)
MIDVAVLHSTAAIGTQILLTCSDEHLIVDVGDGTVRDLVSRNVDFQKIKGVLLTHEHFDHFSGLYGFLHFSRLQRRHEDLALVVPRPVRVINHLLTPPVMYTPLTFNVPMVELAANETIHVSGFEATAFAVDHRGANAFGYSIQDQQGFRIVVSGDTMPCVDLERQLEGADIAILEATYSAGSEDLASKYGHMTKSQALELGRRAKKMILIHANPESYFKTFQCAVK